jgi:hypothetical protein
MMGEDRPYLILFILFAVAVLIVVVLGVMVGV